MDIKQLTIKKRTYKTQLTLFETYLAELIITNENKEQQIECLKKRLSKIEPLFDLFVELNNELSCLQDQELDTNELATFQDKYFTLNSKAAIIIEKYCDVQSQSSISSDKNSNIQRGTKVTLPTINLPTFDGTFTQWREFKDKFNSLIDSDTELTNTQKLTYLKSALKGEPADSLCSLETTDTNYAIAWSRLEKRYNNKRRIINNHVQALLNIQPIIRESYQGIRTLINLAQNHIDCLKTFDVAVDQWDAVLVPILTLKLDTQTNKEWEAKLNRKADNADKIPTVDELLEFLNVKQNTLESTYNRNKSDNLKLNINLKSRETKAFATVMNSCIYCQNDHSIIQCDAFLKLNETQRNTKARELKICLNCLRKGHFVQDCRSTYSCKTCKRKHHSLLHVEHKQIEKHDENKPMTTTKTETSVVSASCTNHSCSTSQVFLSTAKVMVLKGNTEIREIRILLDSASQSNFITQKMCKLLNLKPEKVNLSVKGINNTNSPIDERVQITIKSRHNNYKTTLTCFVLPTISNNLPLQSVNVDHLKIPPNIKLADPTFNQSGSIDLLIGANLFYDLLCLGQIREQGLPTLQKTKLGWVVSGSYIQSTQNKCTEINSYLTLNDLHKTVEQFWNQEDINSNKRLLSNEEQYCEKLFQTTTTRDETGRFIVKIPFKNNLNELGDSKQVANKRFLSLERRLNRDPILQKQYVTFMDEYNSLDHMTKIEQIREDGFYLPHHPVENQNSETTKLRVVFDGSCSLENGLSINETQCTGPTIQNDLVSIISRFRTYKYVITADIAKMYRQVLIHPDDRKYQQILWRSQPDDELCTFELNTVTYGTTAAPFLAIRALTQLAHENEFNYTQESQIIKQDFYVDDLLTGSDSLEQLTSIKINITNILNSGGFNLRKWTSNVKELGDNIASNESKTIQITDKLHKTLGVYWNPKSDEFTYIMNLKKPQDQITKRTILATTAQLFDPLGLLAPSVIIAKFILQDIWKLNIGWDETVPMDIYTRWVTFKDHLTYLNQIKIQRYALIPNYTQVEIHAFADASEKGYGACVYLKSINDQQECQISLFTAKSKVAPIKLVTLPRLELCAAVIAAQLVNKIKSTLNLKINQEYYWSDSTITICWINSQPAKYNTYVANRITEIQSLTDVKNWHHVQSQENPADLISRGILPNKLINLDLWWQGPKWLKDLPDLPIQQLEVTENDVLPEQRKIKINSFVSTTNKPRFIIEKYSSFTKVKRIVAYCLRFCHNCSVTKGNRNIDPLTVEEIKNAEFKLIKQTQSECFHEDLNKLKLNGKLNPKSKLISLSPFLESVLNSRPLTPLTSDPNDIEALTPAHFLIGRQFNTIPDPSMRDIKCSRLSRYEHLQQINQRFWDHWSKSYISELQQRYKWTTNQAQLEVGTMVLIKDDNSPPSRWHLGRIIALHPGKDNLVRVVSIKCVSGEVKRAISKICVLPVNDSSN